MRPPAVGQSTQAAAPPQLRAVLVVDDNPGDAIIIEELLSDIAPDVRTVVAHSLSEARRALVDTPIDAILLDLGLPDTTGLTGVAVLTAAAPPEVPVVVVTGNPDPSLVMAALAEGAQDHCSKRRLTPTSLLDTLHRAVARKQLMSRTSDRAGMLAIEAIEAIEAATIAIDGHGHVLASNGAWEAAAIADASGEPITVGSSYLAAWEDPHGPWGDDRANVASGLRAVLTGDADQLTVDNRCTRGAPDGRWFTVRAVPLGKAGGGAVVSHVDITPIKQAEEALRLSEPRLRSFVDHAAELVVVCTADGTVLHASQTAQAMFGRLAGTRVDHAQVSIGELVHQVDRSAWDTAFADALSRPRTACLITVRVGDSAGYWHRVRAQLVNLLDDPDVGAVLVTASDITARWQKAVAERLHGHVVDRLPVALVVTDDAGVVVRWNVEATTLYGHAADDALGRDIRELSVFAEHGQLLDDIDRSVAVGQRWEGHVSWACSEPSERWIHLTADAMTDDELGFRGIVIVSNDVSERRRLSEDLEHLALHDSLTGLPNRRLLFDRIATGLSRTRRGEPNLGILFLDLDGFKLINDSLGHTVGDEVLRSTALLIGAALRDGDTVARFSGDEFVVICDGIAEAHEAVHVAERIQRALSAPLRADGHQLYLTLSIGIALARGDGASPESLLRDADAAMYRAKAAGKNRIALFDESMHDEALARLRLEAALRGAIDEDQLSLAFQPIVELETMQIAKVEALARWTHPVDGVISPGAFIPIAEETGLIIDLGRRVLRDACAAASGWWKRFGARAPAVSVNLSSRQLTLPTLVDEVAAVLRSTGLAAEMLTLEVTESAIMDDAETSAQRLEELRALGVRIEIDDFGTGYSSLSYLKRLPVQSVKADRSFIDGLADDPEDQAIVAAIVSLADTLGLQVVAEGVETADQLRELRRLGCAMAQGFFLHRPMPHDALVDVIERAHLEAVHVAGRKPSGAGGVLSPSGRAVVRGNDGEVRRLREGLLRRLLRVTTPDQAVAELVGFVHGLGGRTVPASTPDDDVLPVDLSFGLLDEPLLPAAAPGSAARAALDNELAVVVEDVRATVDRLQQWTRTSRDAALDPLTGLLNRRAGEASLRRGTAGSTIVMLDLDHFKQLNDTHGHDAGDAVLQAFGEELRLGLREADSCVRFGGEEFVLLLPATSVDNAAKVIERIAARWRQRRPLPVTFSAGLAAIDHEGLDAARAAADAALYRAKAGGRDRIETAPAHTPSASDESLSPARSVR